MAAEKQVGMHPITALLFSWATDLVREWGDDTIHFSTKEVPEYHYSVFVFWCSGEVAYEYTVWWWDTTYLLEAGEVRDLERMSKGNVLSGLERFFTRKREHWQSKADMARAHRERYWL